MKKWQKNMLKKTEEAKFEAFTLMCKKVADLEKENAELKADRPQWHDLRKDPNDLPDNVRYVWTNAGAGCHEDDIWWDGFGRLQGVIAWCEPKFEE